MSLPLNIDWHQILLHLFNFVILFAVLYFFLYNPVKKFMDKRSEYYKSLDDEANLKLKNSKNAEKEYKEKLAGAESEIADIKQRARKELEEAGAVKIKQAEDEASKIVVDARKTIEAERAKMIKEAQTEISDMVASAAEKLVLKSSTSESYDRFLDAVKGSGIDE